MKWLYSMKYLNVYDAHTHIHTHSQAVHFHCDGVSWTITLNTNTSIAYLPFRVNYPWKCSQIGFRTVLWLCFPPFFPFSYYPFLLKNKMVSCRHFRNFYLILIWNFLLNGHILKEKVTHRYSTVPSTVLG